MKFLVVKYKQKIFLHIMYMFTQLHDSVNNNNEVRQMNEILPSVLGRCWLGGTQGIWPVKN